ncbi:Gfo/Idh/MocA family protein [Microbacterium sp. MC2]
MSARWAVLGAGVISGDFATALPHAELGYLHAVGARDVAAARAFADAHGAAVAGTYDDILARDDVDAVYIGTVHTAHADLAVAALEAGKAVLCEKPLTTNLADTERVLAAAARTELPLLEAFKYRFGPFAQRLHEIVTGGAIGEITAVESSLGFAAAEHTGRLFDPATAGGAILDVGCYPVSLAVGVAAWAGQPLDTARVAETDGVIGATGVDVTASATLELGAVTARVSTSIVEDVSRAAVIEGTQGRIEIPNVWGSRSESTDRATLTRTDGSVERVTAPTVSPMAAEADAVIRALGDGRTEVPEMPWAHTRTVARLLEAWLSGIH